MATKELSIIVKAVDQFTAQFRAITSGITAGIKGLVGGLGSAFSGLISSITNVKTLIAGAFVGVGVYKAVGAFNDAARALDDIGNASQRLGVGVETLSTLRYMAELNGSNWQELADIVKTTERNLGQFAATGGGRAAEFFKRLNVNLFGADRQLRDINELLPELGAAINALPQAERVAYAERIFGNANALQLGLENFKAYREEAEKLGAVFGPEQVKAGMDYLDALDRIGAAWLGLRVKVVAAVGPFLAEMLNKFASLAAAVGRIIGTFGDVLSRAFGGDSDALGRLARVFVTAQALVTVGVANVGNVLVVSTQYVVQYLLRYLDQEFTQWFGTFAEKLPNLISIAYNRAQISIVQGSGEFLGLPASWIDAEVASYQERIDTLVTEIEMINRDARQTINSNVIGSMFATDTPKLTEAVAALQRSVGAAAGEFGDSLDAMLAFREALRGTAFDAALTGTAINDLTGSVQKASNASGFFDGIRQGIQNIKQQAEDLYNTGIQVAQSLTNSISGQLASAIYSVASGAESLGNAFKAFGRQALQTISQVILRVLVLRAVSGLVDGFLGGGSGQMAGGVPQPGVVSGSEFSLGGVQGIARDGGVIVAGGVRRFMAGGTVQGPNLNLDMVHALLAPGERVFSRDEVRRVGARRLDALGAGADPAEVFGGGGGITINQTINVAGGGGGGGGADARMLEGIRKATYDGLLAALSARPALRQGLRAALA